MILKAHVAGVFIFTKVALISNIVMLFRCVYLYHLLADCTVLTQVAMEPDPLMDNPHMCINPIFVGAFESALVTEVVFDFLMNNPHVIYNL